MMILTRLTDRWGERIILTETLWVFVSTAISIIVQVMNLIEKIEDLDDVQNVYSTLEVTDEAIAAMEGAA